MVRVIHTGQALVDEVATIAALPARGGNAVATSFHRYAGGATNILVAAARAGADCVHAGSLGTGPNGDLIREALAADGVQVSSPAVESVDSGICVVLVEAGGERTFVTTQGAERLISEETLETSAPRRGDLVNLTGYSFALESTRDPLLRWLAGLASDVRVVLDPGAPFAGLDAELRSRVLSRTDVFTSNLDEASSLTGETTMKSAAASMLSMLRANAVAVVRDGRNGCAVAQDGVATEVPGYPQDAVDTNGAGDCHTGFLVAELALGTPLEQAAQRANAAAAIKVTRVGPASSPARSEVDALMTEGRIRIR